MEFCFNTHLLFIRANEDMIAYDKIIVTKGHYKGCYCEQIERNVFALNDCKVAKYSTIMAPLL